MKCVLKQLLAVSLLFGMVCSAGAVTKSDLDMRITKLRAKFEKMQAKPDRAIPADVLKKAQGIVLLDRTKAGFIFAYQGGAGLAMVKDKSGKWGPIAFMRADEGSIGFQVGGQQSFMVILMMNPESTKLLTDPSFEFGGEASGTAGESSAKQGANVPLDERSVLVYDDRAGLFGGAALKGGAVSPDMDANFVYYGSPLTIKEILFDNKVKPTEAAQGLAQQISGYAEAAKSK